jgi:hypothetical protein
VTTVEGLRGNHLDRRRWFTGDTVSSIWRWSALVYDPFVLGRSSSRPAWAGRRWVLAVCIIVVSGCTGSGSSGAGSTTVPASTAVPGSVDSTTSNGTQITDTATTLEPDLQITTDQAQEALTTMAFADPSTIGRVELYKESPAMVDAAAATAKSAPTGATKWAVVYVLANADGHAADLVPFLTDADVTIRVMAAIGSIGQGEPAGFPILVEALAADQPMAAFDPPMAAWQAASIALARHTALTLGPAFDADAADRLDSQQRWHDWWTANSGGVHFDETAELWSAA